jgi:predicted permease
VSDLGRTFQQSLRLLKRHPAVATVVVLTLALGIGADTAIFSVANSVLLRPLSYTDADDLVALFTYETQKGERRNPTSPADFLEWKRGSQTLDQMTGAHPWSPVLTGRGQAEPIPGLKATIDLFALLQARPAIGQVFGDEPGSSPADVVVLSDRLWRQRFGGDPQIVGQSLTLDGKPYAVVGVMPPGFRFPPFWATDAELWTPLRLTAADESNDSRMLRVFARLRPGATVAEAQAEMDVIGRRLTETRPEADAGIAVNVEGLREPVVSQVRPALLILLGAVSGILLIACANVASLLLAQGLKREKEVALRAALGASRRRIMGQLLTESLALALLGGLAGLSLASLGVDLFRLLTPEGFPRLEEIHLDGRVIAWSLLLSILTGVFSGLAPALRASRTDLLTALNRGDGRMTSSRGRRLHDVLVIGEFALAVILLIGAGLMLKSFAGLLRPEPGFRPDHLLTMSVSLSGSPFGEPARQGPFFDDLVARVASVPGVESAALVNHVPIAGDTWGMAFTAEGQTPVVNDPPSAVFRVVTANYPRAAGIPLLGGRSFTDDDRADTTSVVLVNETLARRFWPHGDAVGKRIRPGGPASAEPWLTIVGVLGDTRQASLTGAVRPEILFPYAQNPVAWYRSTTLVVRTTGEPLSVAEAVKAQALGLHGDLPITHVRAMTEVLRESIGQDRLNASLLGLFAATALLLAVVGLYGVMTYAVSRRIHEIGIRMAVGAKATEVFRLVVGHGLRLSLLGTVLGIAGALVASRALAGLLFGVSPTDPATYVGIALLLLGVSFLACAIPARRAAQVDPVVALREE